MMNYRRLGNSGLKVSEICLGAWINFGGRIADEQTFAVIDAAVEEGINFFDTANRTIELEVIPACKHYGLGLIPWSPLEGGVFGGVLKKQADGRRSSDLAQKAIAKHGDAIVKYEALCDRIGTPPGDVALAWLLANPVVTAPIVGPRTMEQLESALRARAVNMDDAVIKELDGLFPGPGGAAPEAYAW